MKNNDKRGASGNVATPIKRLIILSMGKVAGYELKGDQTNLEVLFNRNEVDVTIESKDSWNMGLQMTIRRRGLFERLGRWWRGE